MQLALRVVVILAFSVSAISCQPLVESSPEKIAPWTTLLRDSEPDDAFTAVYAWRGKQLVFIAAKHSTRTDSQTFRLIDQAYASFHFDTVIVEGPPYSSGANPERLMSWAQAQRAIDGFLEGGEIVPTIRGAQDQQAVVWGGEPDDATIRARVVARGFELEDLLGFYTLRSIPQWIREKKITDAGDSQTPQLIEAELKRNRTRLQAPEGLLPNYANWVQWYERTNNKPFGATFELEETGPLADGRYATNKISEAIARVRDEFLLDVIAQHLNAQESVLVVYGKSHLTLLRSALDYMLGRPCYAGESLQAGRGRCSRKQ
jgi:hypothetical protein